MPFIKLNPIRTDLRDLRIFIDPLSGMGIDSITQEEGSLSTDRLYTHVQVGQRDFLVKETVDEVIALVSESCALPETYGEVSFDNPDAYRS